MPRRRIRRDRIPRATISIKLDVDLVKWLNDYENRSQMIENAVNRLKKEKEQEKADLKDRRRKFLRLDDDGYDVGVHPAVKMINNMQLQINHYERFGIRPKTARFLKYELRQWSKAVRTFEETGEVDE